MTWLPATLSAWTKTGWFERNGGGGKGGPGWWWKGPEGPRRAPWWATAEPVRTANRAAIAASARPARMIDLIEIAPRLDGLADVSPTEGSRRYGGSRRSPSRVHSSPLREISPASTSRPSAAL